MTWHIACYCGHNWQGQPPEACPRCGVTLANPRQQRDQAARAFADAISQDLAQLPTTDPT